MLKQQQREAGDEACVLPQAEAEKHTALEGMECGPNTAPPHTAVACLALRTHPFQSLKLHRSCALCERTRDALLERVAERHEVRFRDGRWRVRYASPGPGERGAEWSGVGETLGSWVGEWRGVGDAVVAALREPGGRDKEMGREMGYRGFAV